MIPIPIETTVDSQSINLNAIAEITIQDGVAVFTLGTFYLKIYFKSPLSEKVKMKMLQNPQ